MAGFAIRRVVGTGVGLRAACTPISASVRTAMRTVSGWNGLDTLLVTQPRPHVLHVEMNRPDKVNAMNKAFWREMVKCFNKIADDQDCRAVVLSGAGKLFTAGLDLQDMAGDLLNIEGEDTARKSWHLRQFIKQCQDSFSVLEKCLKPVIAAVHGACIGGGIDMITACDIRLCTHDAWFQVKEVDIGLAADVGTLQRLPKVIGNRSLVCELAYTGRKMMADEAHCCGFISRIFQDKDSMMDGAFELASEIASKSPVAVQGTKRNLLYSRDHTIQDSLEYMAAWNMSMLQTDDLVKSAGAVMQKKTSKEVTFSKL